MRGTFGTKYLGWHSSKRMPLFYTFTERHESCRLHPTESVFTKSFTKDFI